MLYCQALRCYIIERTRVASFGPRIGDTETESRKRSSIARFFDVFSTLVDLVDPISRLHIAAGVVKMADKRSINEENNGEFFFCEWRDYGIIEN